VETRVSIDDRSASTDEPVPESLCGGDVFFSKLYLSEFDFSRSDKMILDITFDKKMSLITHGDHPFQSSIK
jgi:hypothetical protein